MVLSPAFDMGSNAFSQFQGQQWFSDRTGSWDQSKQDNEKGGLA
jgi:hypothetical protein